jgi:hypothetical protein
MKIEYLIGNSPAGPKDTMMKVISNLDGVHKELGDHAAESARRAKTSLALHKHDGDAKITTTEGDVDWFVNLDDTAGQSAALSIEFGHRSKSGKLVPALYIITKATGWVN